MDTESVNANAGMSINSRTVTADGFGTVTGSNNGIDAETIVESQSIKHNGRLMAALRLGQLEEECAALRAQCELGGAAGVG